MDKTSVSIAGSRKGGYLFEGLKDITEATMNEIRGLTTAEEIISKLGLSNGEKVLNKEEEVSFVSYPDEKVVPGAYKSGFNVLGKGQIIPKHFHVKDFEIYIVIYGKVEINEKVYAPGDVIICRKGESHYCINLFYEESIIKFIKKM